MATAAMGMTVEVKLGTVLRAHSPAVVVRAATVRLAETARVPTEMALAEMAMEPAVPTPAEERMVMAALAAPQEMVRPAATGAAVTVMEMVLAIRVMALLAAPWQEMEQAAVGISVAARMVRAAAIRAAAGFPQSEPVGTRTAPATINALALPIRARRE
jgi:hypothetical protein